MGGAAAALRAYASYCELTGLREFPITTDILCGFTSSFRDAGTLNNYIAGLRFICELIGARAECFDDPRVRRAVMGVKKSQFVF